MTKRISDIFKYLLVAAVIAFISLLFPKLRQPNPDYQVGDRWERETLVAPFDFPVLKDESALEEERQEVRSSVYPYFSQDTSTPRLVRQTVLEQLRDYANSDSTIGPDEYQILETRVRSILSGIYESGVIGSQVPEEWQRDYIHLVKGNSSSLVRRDEMLTRQEAGELAGELIRASDLREASALHAVLPEEIRPNVVFDPELTARFLEAELDNISFSVGKVSKGDVIINKNDVITQEDLRLLRSYHNFYEEQASTGQGRWEIFAGYLLLTVLLIGVLLFYLQMHYRKVFARFASLAFMLFWTVLFSYLVFAIEQTDNISTYIIPFCIVPIVVKNFYNDSLALYIHLVVVLLASFLSKLGYEFTFLQLMAGIVTVLVVKETRFWSKFFASILFIFMTYAVGFFGLSMVETGDLSRVDWSMYVWFSLNAVLTLLAYPLIPLLERIFGYTSSITLAELNDLNNPLMRELSVKAPGTLQHSLQVANLGEAVADKIGANSLLVRVGALYHDIGKMAEPRYFIENQTGENPHDKLSEKESAEKIIAHVTTGAKMARKARLPKVVIDFILTHHGTTRVEYFYRTFLKNNPEEEVSETDFRYPGPKPWTREQAILMLADSVEAASKSLKNPEGKEIDDLVDRIMEGKINMGQLEKAELTFSEYETCRNILKEMLRNINHVRIEYPEEMEEAVRKGLGERQ